MVQTEVGMKISIWYHTVDKQPDKTGYYLCYRGWGMGGKADGDSDQCYLYYDKKKKMWKEYDDDGSDDEVSFVYYWTDADPRRWVEEDQPVFRRKKEVENVALADAWKSVQDAISKYEMIKILVS